MNDNLLIDQIVDYAVFKHTCNYRIIIPKIGKYNNINSVLKIGSLNDSNVDFVDKPHTESPGWGKPDKMLHGIEIYYLHKNLTFEKFVTSNKSYNIFFLIKELLNIDYSSKLRMIEKELPRLDTELNLLKYYKKPLSKKHKRN